MWSFADPARQLVVAFRSSKKDYRGCVTDIIIIIARVACFCKMLVKNRFQPARPAGRPRANHLSNYRFWPVFSKWKKWIFPEPITSSIRDFEATFFTSPISIASACSSGRPLFARLRRPALLVYYYLFLFSISLIHVLFFSSSSYPLGIRIFVEHGYSHYHI